MNRWLPRVMARIREPAAARRLPVTDKARREIARLDLGLDREDVCELIAALGRADFSARVMSRSSGEWMYVFKPQVAGITLYVKLILRASCVVVSFHEDQTDPA